MKYILPFGIMLLFSCNSRDPKMCDCLDAGDKLNKFSSKLLTKEASQKDVVEMKKLKAEKVKKCADFQMMSGEEMLKKKASCAE